MQGVTRGGGERSGEFTFIFQLAFSYQLGNRCNENFLSTSDTKKRRNRYKQKSQVQRKSRANAPRDNKSILMGDTGHQKVTFYNSGCFSSFIFIFCRYSEAQKSSLYTRAGLTKMSIILILFAVEKRSSRVYKVLIMPRGGINLCTSLVYF